MVVVLADSRVVSIVPSVDAADQVESVDMSVGEQGSAVVSPTAHDRHAIIETDDDEIDSGPPMHRPVRGR